MKKYKMSTGYSHGKTVPTFFIKYRILIKEELPCILFNTLYFSNYQSNNLLSVPQVCTKIHPGVRSSFLKQNKYNTPKTKEAI